MHHRKLAALAGLASLFASVSLAIGVSPAGAHHPEVSGIASCPAADHEIAWTIGNSQAVTRMTITSADAVLNGTSYAVTGYSSPVAPLVPTHATTTIPGTLTGDVVLTVAGRWPDGHVETRDATVTLEAPCPEVPTTTAPPTTVGVSPTTAPPPHVTPTTAKHAVVPPANGTDGSSGKPELARTGFSSEWLLLIGFALVLLGFGAVCWLRYRETIARERGIV